MMSRIRETCSFRLLPRALFLLADLLAVLRPLSSPVLSLVFLAATVAESSVGSAPVASPSLNV